MACPQCLRMARFDERGAIVCLAGCPPIRASNAEPPAGWELANAGNLHRYQARAWGLLPLLENSPDWDAYHSTKSPLQERWGRVGDAGDERYSLEGAHFGQQHTDDSKRIDEMTEALDAFGAGVRANARLPRSGVSATRIIGGALVLELANAIRARGGAYAGIAEMLRQVGSTRVTPFSGVRHALAFAFGDHGSLLLGEGSPLAGMGGAEALFKIPCGLQFNTVSCSPSHVGSGAARNVGAFLDNHDVWACLKAARVGGEWSPAPESGEEVARTCKGGRPLTSWELKLLQYCDVGANVTHDYSTTIGAGWQHVAVEVTFRCLTPAEAVDRVRQEVASRGRATRDTWASLDDAVGARHLTLREGRIAIRSARRSVAEALDAWGLIPERRPQDREPRRGECTGRGRWPDDRDVKPDTEPRLPRRASELL